MATIKKHREIMKRKGRGGPPGNQYRLEFDTKEKRAKLFAELIKHLENGWDRASFAPCDWETVERYVDKFPDEFPINKIIAATRRGHQVIEGIVRGVAQGKIKGNASAAIFLAKNKIGYRDKCDINLGNVDGKALKTEQVTPTTVAEAAEAYRKLVARRPDEER